jgi:hypothetical protein
MTLDFTVDGEVKITMIPYIKEIVKQFQEHDNSTKTAATPAAEHLFKVNEDTTPLTQRQATVFHNFVAKSLFLTKRARPDIATAVAFLTTRVKSSDEDEHKAMVIKILFYTKTTKVLSSSKRMVASPAAREPNISTVASISSPTASILMKTLSSIVLPKRWSEIFTPSLCKANSFTSSENLS